MPAYCCPNPHTVPAGTCQARWLSIPPGPFPAAFLGTSCLGYSKSREKYHRPSGPRVTVQFLNSPPFRTLRWTSRRIGSLTFGSFNRQPESRRFGCFRWRGLSCTYPGRHASSRTSGILFLRKEFFYYPLEVPLYIGKGKGVHPFQSASIRFHKNRAELINWERRCTCPWDGKPSNR